MITKHQEEEVKPPRACELCLNKRAVWFCASDDAFLCHVCDESVHSANQVVTKHERVWLRTNEVSPQGTTSKPVWYSGFRRKARTPRVRCEKNPQQKIYDERSRRRRRRKEDSHVPETNDEDNDNDDLASLVPEFHGFTEMGFNFEVEDLYCNHEEAKADGDEEHKLMNWEKDYDNVIAATDDYTSNAKQRSMLLRLNYENVIAAWEDKQESPRSNFQLVPPGMEEEEKARSKSEREARVWRYRDKRKNRLFEKKIRYEVRKVNADKRPRMKGRFVRRTLATNS